MERTINPDVWDILTEDEKTAISLSLGHNKSTWESGEIMGRAHFKYLEIQKRARKYLEIFTNHFEKYESLFPESISSTLTFSFKEYLHLTMIKRMHISRAVTNIEDSSYGVASKRNKSIIHEIEKLKKINSESALDLYGLIMDFDRWNNFRILPLEIQEPSAFKRRNKARDVKHLKKMISLPRYSVLTIIEKYSYSGKYNKLYLPLISRYIEGNYEVIPIRRKNINIEEVSRAGLFLFESRAKADEFGALVAGYFINNFKNCKSGQKFWPEYRDRVLEAVNFKQLQNIHKSRTYLDQAWFDRDLIRKRKKQLDRTQDEKTFYLGKNRAFFSC